MKLSTKKQVTYEREVSQYTCSRCKEPCGDNEPTTSMYDVKAAYIALRGQRAVAMMFGENDPEACLRIVVSHRVEILSKEGSHYPGDGEVVEKVIIDSCVRCFHEAAVPALVAAGFSIRKEES